jgi:hypothetical protein
VEADAFKLRKRKQYPASDIEQVSYSTILHLSQSGE